MDELRERRPGRESLLQEVLDRLDVVVRGALDRLDGTRVGLGEVGRNRVQALECGRVGRRTHLGHVREASEPRGLDPGSGPDEGELAEPRAKLRRLPGVASVERREGVERGELHGRAGVAPRRAVTPRAGG